MGFSLDIAKHTRLNFIKLMDGLSIEQLNFIPEGYTNNIAWNFAHIVAAQQTLCYVRGHVSTRMPIDKVTKYQKGSAPEGFISEEELAYYKDQAFVLLDKLKADVAANLFTSYERVTTAFGVTINNINGAITYFTTHDTLHLGYAQALRRAVINSEKAIESSIY
ncbi:DinB family protein [Mucilaginibacter lacusdianchii]|uniref:DinB family protein n=1 Tax=Mucilaginibacter lacusdianchii TaxID=2684211 RepID=UPI00131D8CCB|nr:DinB family protein [Mucilaginibacter sp. JXJ CY 39]